MIRSCRLDLGGSRLHVKAFSFLSLNRLIFNMNF